MNEYKWGLSSTHRCCKVVIKGMEVVIKFYVSMMKKCRDREVCLSAHVKDTPSDTLADSAKSGSGCLFRPCCFSMWMPVDVVI